MDTKNQMPRNKPQTKVTLYNSIKRLAFTISNQNKPNESDVDAINSVIEHINDIEQKTKQENILYAKLYTLFLSELTVHYGNVDFANKILNKELEKPFQNHLDQLLLSLKRTKAAEYYSKNEIKDTFLQGKNADELKKIAAFHPTICDVNVFMEYYDFWNKEKAESFLVTNINLSFQKFKNYD